jgi:O-glycosyl hydrolase
LFFVFLLSCEKSITSVTIDINREYQYITGFGASDCWTANFVGQYWNEAEKETIARYLFGRGYGHDGDPEGIGLSMWRFNLGAGTAEQGNDSGIADLSRRAESFLIVPGKDGPPESAAEMSYDWSKQAGQQWFLRKAKEYGCEHFVAFSNAPPVQFSRNGKGYASGSVNDDGRANLREDAWDDFADYLAAVADHFKREGLPFEYLSPVNEPQWDWKDPSQEGSPWESGEIKRLTIELDRAIREKGLDTKILLAEAGEWDKLYLGGGRASNQITEFFNPQSENYVGHLPSVAQVIGGHSYWTGNTDLRLRNTRISVQNNARRFGLEVFQTEWSMLDAGEGFPGFDEASYMDIALFMAKVIHSDLTFANVSSWSFWTSMDMERWGHKNRFLLVSLAPGKNNDPYTPITEPGSVQGRSTLWALGNYSLFIRPGYRRVELSGVQNLSGLMGSAYISADRSVIVAVYVNMESQARAVSTEFAGLDTRPRSGSVYVTDENSNLKRQKGTSSEKNASRNLEIPARSVVTAVYTF